MANILIVDDEISAVDLLGLILEQAGYEVLTAGNGQTGFEIARTKRPDIIITDVLMPVMDGYAFYKELKADPATKNIPVIILTARGAMESAFDAIGADCFFEKPPDPKALLERIRRYLQNPNIVSRKTHQNVLVFGIYPEVLESIGDYISSLGHTVCKVWTAAQVIIESVSFNPDIVILEVQTEEGMSSADVIRAIRLLPKLKKIPVIVYSYYRTSDLGCNDFRDRILNLEKAKDECFAAGATEYFERYNEGLFKDQVVKYL
ncbi:MAG: response regulator [Candidatus Omnitrophota bacterium]